MIAGVEESLFCPHHHKLFTTFSISCRLAGEVILLVEMTMPLLSTHMKSAMIPDLIDLRVLLILMICALVSLIYLLAASLLMGTMICLWERLLVVMLIWDLGLLSFPLMIFCTWSIFLFCNFGNIFLILSIFMIVFKELEFRDLEDAWVYDFF